MIFGETLAHQARLRRRFRPYEVLFVQAVVDAPSVRSRARAVRAVRDFDFNAEHDPELRAALERPGGTTE